MKIANFSKQERRGLIGILVLLLLIIIVIICQKYSSSESEEMLDSADKSFYEEILIYQEAVEVEFDSISKVQKESTNKIRKKSKSKKKEKKEYPDRNPYAEPINVK